MMPSKINIIRDGKRHEMLAREIVPGDLIYLDEGSNPKSSRFLCSMLKPPWKNPQSTKMLSPPSLSR